MDASLASAVSSRAHVSSNRRRSATMCADRHVRCVFECCNVTNSPLLAYTAPEAPLGNSSLDEEATEEVTESEVITEAPAEEVTGAVTEAPAETETESENVRLMGCFALA